MGQIARAEGRSQFASDAALVASMRDGEPGAWRAFVAEYAGLIRAVIIRHLRRSPRFFRRSDVEEVYSTFMCSLIARDMHRLRAFDPERRTRLSSWISVLALNATRDYVRAARTLEARTVGLGAEQVLRDERYDPGDALQRRRVCAELGRAVKRLSARDRELLELLFVDGMSHQQIAATMNITVSTVHTKKHKLTARLRTLAAGV